MLYTIIKFSINTGKKIRKTGIDRKEYIEFSSENESSIDSSLGSLIGYARHYSDLWSVNSFVKNYIANRLSEFRDKYRNDHFHKDNIYSVEEIETIRNNTIMLLYLLLGAMDISDSNFASIDYSDDDSNTVIIEELPYTKFKQWLDRIMGGDVLLPLSSNIYFSVNGRGEKNNKWAIVFITYKGFDKNGCVNGIKYPYLEDDLEWDYVCDADDAEVIRQTVVNQAKAVVKQYLEDGRYSKKLKSYSSISVGWAYGGYERYPEILFKRQ